MERQHGQHIPHTNAESSQVKTAAKRSHRLTSNLNNLNTEMFHENPSTVLLEMFITVYVIITEYNVYYDAPRGSEEQNYWCVSNCWEMLVCGNSNGPHYACFKGIHQQKQITLIWISQGYFVRFHVFVSSSVFVFKALCLCQCVQVLKWIHFTSYNNVCAITYNNVCELSASIYIYTCFSFRHFHFHSHCSITISIIHWWAVYLSE